MPNIYPALAIQTPDVAGNFLAGIQQGQEVQNARVRNQLLQDEQAARAAAMQRDEQFRNILAQSVGPMAAGAAQPPGSPGGDMQNYLMQGTGNPLAGPSPEQFNQLIQLDPERAFQMQAQFEAQRQARQVEMQQRAGRAVRSAEFVLKSKDPKRTLEIGFPEMVEQMRANGIELDDLDDDAVRAMANDVIAQMGPMAGVGPAGPGEGFTLSQGQKRFDANGNEIASVDPAATDEDPNDKLFQRTRALSNDFARETAGFEAIRSAYENVQNAKANDSGDTQLVLNYMRVISPGVRVQPGERIEDAASVPGIPQQVVGIWNKLVNKGKLNDEQRNEIRQQAKRTYETQRRLASESRTRFTNAARFAQVDPYGVVGDDWAPVAEFDAQGVRMFDTAEQAEAAGLKPGTRIIVGGRPATFE